MKKTFQKMLQIELCVDDDEKYATNGVCIILVNKNCIVSPSSSQKT